MVYLAELLVVMTDGLKIIRICARNVPRTRTQVLIDDDAFLASLSLQESKGVAYSMSRSAVLLKHTKNRLHTTCECLAVASKQESCREVRLLEV